MERYLVDVTNLRLDGQEQPQTSADGTPKARMYLAAPVDARIAELENALREAMIWNWAEWAKRDPTNPPADLVDRISALLANRSLMVPGVQK